METTSFLTNGFGERPNERREEEPIMMGKSQKFCMSSIRREQLQEILKKATASTWDTSELRCSPEKHWNSLTNAEKHFITHVLAFAAGFMGTCMTLAKGLSYDIEIPAARSFFRSQCFSEGVHRAANTMLWFRYVELQGRPRVREEIENLSHAAGKAKWAMDWSGSFASVAERTVAWACVTGILFSGSMCAIFWLKMRGMMRDVTSAYERIHRDENRGFDFACLLYSSLPGQLPWKKVHDLVHEAVEIEARFICEILPCSLIGMNSNLMRQYIEFEGDRVLVALGYERKYKVENPFYWAKFISEEQ